MSAIKLGDFITLQRGTTYKGQLLGQEGVVLIGLASIQREGGFRDDKLETYGGECPEKISLRAGDLYVSLKDITNDGHLLGAVARIPEKIKLGRLTQDTVKLVFLKDEFPRNYIYWLLRTPQCRNYCRSLQTGTTNLGLGREDFLSFQVPPLTDFSSSIVESLEAIEKKIENLRRQNETLEQIARSLFKHWFIDFEFPNAISKPYKSSGGAMFASELGNIPEGWCVTTIEKIASRIAMGPFGSRITTDNFVNSGIPIIRGGNLVNGFNEDSFVYLTPEKADELKSSNVFPEDIVFTHRGTLGQVGFIPTNAKHPRYVVSQSQMFLSVNKSLASSRFVYHFFSSKIGIDALLANKNTTGVPSIARPSTSLKAIQIVLPENKIMERFDALITSIDFKKDSNTKQIQTLTKTRDSLLPKLMSGQLRVKE
ncbi:MAG: restriction endonuclease subunit S [Pseudanabaena sp.]|jgi:type I restriction enzyme S subunit